MYGQVAVPAYTKVLTISKANMKHISLLLLLNKCTSAFLKPTIQQCRDGEDCGQSCGFAGEAEGREQAGLVWQHLFVDCSPMSEACHGVLTTLHLKGLDHLVTRRDLSAIQKWFKHQDAEGYVDTVCRLAGIK